jgi:hypothetical protein
MVSSGMLRSVALVRTDFSEELSVSFIRVTRVGELGTTLDLTRNRRMLRRNTWLLVTVSVVPISSILVTLMKEAVSSSEKSILTRATRRNIPEDTILYFSEYILYSINTLTIGRKRQIIGKGIIVQILSVSFSFKEYIKLNKRKNALLSPIFFWSLLQI